MKTTIRILFFIASMLFIVGCWMDEAWVIEVKNNSSKEIYVYGDYILPDTTLPIQKPKFIEAKKERMGEIYDIDVNDPEFRRLEKDRLTIFLLSKDTVDKYDWSIIRDNYMILKRYELNDKELTEMKWEINYP